MIGFVSSIMITMEGVHKVCDGLPGLVECSVATGFRHSSGVLMPSFQNHLMKKHAETMIRGLYMVSGIFQN